MEGDNEEQETDMLSTFPRPGKLEVVVSWPGNSAPMSAQALVNKENSLMHTFKANFAFDSENVWEVVGQGERPGGK